MYKVIYKFADLQDGKHVYNVGDAYPFDGSKPSQKRIDELASSKNKIGKPLIEEIPEAPMKYEDTRVGQIGDVPIEETKVEVKERRGRKKKAEEE